MPTRKFPVTWVVTADVWRARFRECLDRQGPLQEVADLALETEEMHGNARDLKSDKPGRAFSSTEASRSMMEPHHDPVELAKLRFAKAVARQVNDAFRRNQFKRLVISTPPKMLGALRQDICASAQQVIAGELDKDMMKATPQAIFESVEPFLR
ncbi:MAG TPA: host attachment protein [Ferrovibrio sp.]|uniref:host attachment protein n=1 Tax=Ferrovibrio sp. TaxID=1917215 RepID=UPI002ED38806